MHTTLDPTIECPVREHLREVARLRRAIDLARDEETAQEQGVPADLIDDWSADALIDVQLLPLIQAQQDQAIRKAASSLEGVIFQLMLVQDIFPASDIDWKDEWYGHEGQRRLAMKREDTMKVGLERALSFMLALSNDPDLQYVSKCYVQDGVLKTAAFDNLMKMQRPMAWVQSRKPGDGDGEAVS